MVGQVEESTPVVGDSVLEFLARVRIWLLATFGFRTGLMIAVVLARVVGITVERFSATVKR